jgi:hypothetical protein
MRKDPCCPGVIAAILEPLMARSASNLMRLLAVTCLAALCACGSAQKKQTVAEKANLLDQTITEKQLDQLSNAFADRYFTLMLAASERIMRDNPDLQQRRIMNGLRVLGVSSMYDIATSPDTVTQLIDQLVVVTLQNYFWVDSGRSQMIWGDRAQYLVQNLRRAREDIWSIGARVFTREQLDELDLLISNWWSTNGGTEFVAYVRFSDVAAGRGSALIEEVKSGGGLLEPLDRATEQVAQANFALERSFFWAKRVPLFAGWNIQAITYDFLVMPESQRLLKNINAVSDTTAALPELLASKGELGKELLAQYKDSIVATGVLLDKVAPLTTNTQAILRESDTAMKSVTEALRIVQAMQQASAAANAGAPPAKPVDVKEYEALLQEVHRNLVEANKLLSTTTDLTDQKQLAERLKPIEALIQMRIREVQGATDEVAGRLVWRVAMLVAGVLAALFAFHVWKRRQAS